MRKLSHGKGKWLVLVPKGMLGVQASVCAMLHIPLPVLPCRPVTLGAGKPSFQQPAKRCWEQRGLLEVPWIQLSLVVFSQSAKMAGSRAALG